MSDAKYVWSWDQCLIANCHTNENTVEFVEWIDRTIPADIQQFYPGTDSLQRDQIASIGLSPHRSRRYLVCYELLDITLENSNSCVFTGEYRYRGKRRFFTYDLPTYIALNWYVTGAVRLGGITDGPMCIHARIDDELLGSKPVTPGLKDAQELLKGWLHMQWGEQLNPLLEELKYGWHPHITFCEEIMGTGDQRKPVNRTPIKPDLYQYLPFV